uniref:Plectin n=1 Tax=Petromyzon marinus TaxID=7757 RepID=S4RYB2_PETMA
PHPFSLPQALYNQYLQFKEMELPPKESDKMRIKTLYKSLEAWILAGRIKLPQGQHPNDVEKEWGRLIVAMLEREKELRPEIERSLEMLQRVALQIQQESGVCEEKLMRAERLLHMELHAGGTAGPGATELEVTLGELDALIRSMFANVQTLKDGRYFQAENMYRRVFQLHERVVALRSEHRTAFSPSRAAGSAVETQTARATLETQTTQTDRGSTAEEEATVSLRDLLQWVETQQVALDAAEWGTDLPAVEANLEAHRGTHRDIEAFRARLEQAKAAEPKVSSANRGTYSEYLGRLELQYTRLLNSSRGRLRHLESLERFVSRATHELMWLNAREEEEVAHDWSNRNPDVASKREYHEELMKELEKKEVELNALRDGGEQLLVQNHPARETIEAYLAAIQSQWHWILQICSCVETHLKENTTFFQVRTHVRVRVYARNVVSHSIPPQTPCKKKYIYSCAVDFELARQDEKEQLVELKRTVAGLVGRAKTIVQQKPRDPENRVAASIPIRAVCDYKQMEITIHKGEECALEDNSQRSKWRVINPTGNIATVPSVCFLVPPPNPDAMETAARIEQLYQSAMALWHQQHVNMKSVVSYLYLIKDIEIIRSWNVITIWNFSQIKPQPENQYMESLVLIFQRFLCDMKENNTYRPQDNVRTHRNRGACRLRVGSAVRAEEEGESLCGSLLSRLQKVRLRLEGCEERVIRQIRTPLDPSDPLQDSLQRIAEQEVACAAVVQDLGKVEAEMSSLDKESREALAAQPGQSHSVSSLASELALTTQKLVQVKALSTVYLERLKRMSTLVGSLQEADVLLKELEGHLYEEETVPTDPATVSTYIAQLQAWAKEAEETEGRKGGPLASLDVHLRAARESGGRMLSEHGERDPDLERVAERAEHTLERWQSARSQIRARLKELEGLAKVLRSYRESAVWLEAWLDKTMKLQEKVQASKIEDVRGLEEQLEKQKALAMDIEKNQVKVDECQKYSEQYSLAAKDYELQLMTYKAMVDTHQRSPVKRRRLLSTSDSIMQEYMTLRTRYTALVTMTSQYVKFISETLQRLQGEQQQLQQQHSEAQDALRRLADIQDELERQRQISENYARGKAQAEEEADRLRQQIHYDASKRRSYAEATSSQKEALDQQVVELRQNSNAEVRRQAALVNDAVSQRKQVEEEILIIRMELERASRRKDEAEDELDALRARAEEAERRRKAAEQETAKYRQLAETEARRKEEAEAELKKKIAAEQEAANQKRAALAEVERLKKIAEEAQNRKQQAEEEAKKQIAVAQEAFQKSAEAEIQAQKATFVELQQMQQEEQTMIVDLKREAMLRKKVADDAERAQATAKAELEMWMQKAQEALEQKNKAEELAREKSQAQQEAEKQKAAAEREAKARGEAQHLAQKQKSQAEDELGKQLKLSEKTTQQKQQAEQEVKRLLILMQDSEQQKSLLEDELQRLKAEVAEAIRQKTLLEEELAKVRSQMDELIKLRFKVEEENQLKANAEKEKTEKILEEEAAKMKQLAEEAARLKKLADEAMQHRRIMEEETSRQRAEAEKAHKEKLLIIQQASQLKDDAERVLQEQAEENERLRHLAEEEAKQRKLLEEQAAQQKQAIEVEMAEIQKHSELEIQRQKLLVEETIFQRRQIEEEIHIIRVNFENASKGKADLEKQLQKLQVATEETTRLKEKAEGEAAQLKKLAQEEAMKKKEAEQVVQKQVQAEKLAASQFQVAQEELEQLKKKAEEALALKQKAEDEAAKRVKLAEDAAQKRLAAEEKARLAALAEKDAEFNKVRQQDEEMLTKLRDEAELARKAAEEADQARLAAEQEANNLRKQAEQVFLLQSQAEEDAQLKALLQGEAERLRKEAENEAAMRARAEQEALNLKQLAEEEFERQRLLAENIMHQKETAENELAKMRHLLKKTQKQKGLLEDELNRLKAQVMEAIQQKSLVEDELAEVKAQMEDLLRLKGKTEEENRQRAAAESQNIQKILEEEATKMKSLAEEASKLRAKSEETAKLRQQAEEELAKQKALADCLAQEKMQAVEEANKLRADAEVEAEQRRLLEEQSAQQKNRQKIEQQLESKTQAFQRTLDEERRRQQEASSEADRLRQHIEELTKERAQAQEEAIREKAQAEEISRQRLEAEKQVLLKVKQLQETEVDSRSEKELKMESEVVKLRCFIVTLEQEKERLRQEAEKFHIQATQLQVAPQETTTHPKEFLQDSASQMDENEALLLKQKFLDEEKARLQKMYEEELRKTKAQLEAEAKIRHQQEEENVQLRLQMQEALQQQQQREPPMYQLQQQSSPGFGREVIDMLEQQRMQAEADKLLAEQEKDELLRKLRELEENHQRVEHEKNKTRAAEAGGATEGRPPTDGGTQEKELIRTGKKEVTFKGLRRQVTLSELLNSNILTAEMAKQLREGSRSIDEVSGTIRGYLEGTSGIAGLYIEATREKLPLYSGIKRGFLRPGTGLVLMESQAATGYMIDPVNNMKMSVDEAVKRRLVGPEYLDKLLSAERAVTGYIDKFSGEVMSLFQAMKKGLIIKEHGIRLLEAQIATGGIIDPQASHRIPVEMAYTRGLFDEEMNQILLDPSDDTKGFFDPNTEENLSYLDLFQRCIKDPATGLSLLPIKEKKKERKMSSKSSVRKRKVVIVDPDTNEELTVYEAYKRKLIDHQTYIQLSEQECEWEEITTTTGDGVVSSILVDRRTGHNFSIEEALKKGVITQSTMTQYRSGKLAITELADLLSGMWNDPVEETQPVGGILDNQKLEKISIYEALQRKLVDNFTAQRLLEIQACTGGIIDPTTGRRYNLRDAVTYGLLDNRLIQMVSVAEKAFTGYEDPITKMKVPIMVAMKKGLITYESGRRFLEAQYLTGGIVDPGTGQRITLEDSVNWGLVDLVLVQKLRDIHSHFKYLTCPKSRTRMSYKEAMDRCMVDSENGVRLLEAS